MSKLRLIAGSGRSGTTWVLDALAVANGLRPVFEPLNPHASRMGATYAHRAIAPEDSHDELLTFFRDVCAGRRQRLWTQYRRQRPWLFPPSARLNSPDAAAKLWKTWQKFLKEVPQLAWMTTRAEPLVKCIWSNLMLGWLSCNLPCSIVLILRHPGAVIESELRSGWNSKFAVERFRQDRRLSELTNGRYEKLLSRNLTPVEELAARWVIENQQAIESATGSAVTVVFYEQLKSSQAAAWNRIRDALHLSVVPDTRVLIRPSQQAAPRGSEGYSTAATAAGWLDRLSPVQKSQIQGVLDSTGIGVYSMDRMEPCGAADICATTNVKRVAQ